MELKANIWYKVGKMFGNPTDADPIYLDSLTIRTEPEWVKRDD